jgi:hypothetical protein
MTRNIEVVRAGAISFALPLTLILLLQAAALVRMIRSHQPAPAIPAPAALTSNTEVDG